MNKIQGFRRSCIVLFFLALALLGGVLAGQSEPTALKEHAALRDFASWQELTKGPHKVAPRTWSLCVPPPAKQLKHPGELVPFGADRFIRVYANPQAYPLMRAPRGTTFPAGSRIAKVKLLPGSDLPVSVAFMVKREAGYNPASLDWEYLFFDGDSLRQSKGDLSGCQGCHGDFKAGDGVFGSYLPERQHQG
jgi:hypothetical protein